MRKKDNTKKTNTQNIFHLHIPSTTISPDRFFFSFIRNTNQNDLEKKSDQSRKDFTKHEWRQADCISRLFDRDYELSRKETKDSRHRDAQFPPIFMPFPRSCSNTTSNQGYIDVLNLSL